MRIEIVSHCWKYQRLLTRQLSSLVLWPPHRVEVEMTVCYCPEDEGTSAVLAYFSERLRSGTVTLQPWRMLRKELLRRSIGRNIVALESTADWVWFTDCDYLFGDGCLDRLPSQLTKVQGPLAYPRIVRVSTSHAHGDQDVYAVREPDVYSIDGTRFSPRRLDRAIGGVQIVRGDVAREIGYLNDCERSQERVQGDRFASMREDVRFRHNLGTRGERISLPNLFRIRHSRHGWFQHGVNL